MIKKKLTNYSGYTQEEYNAEPLYYCKSCLSLAVLGDESGSGSYCNDCGSAAIGRTNIQMWEEAYRHKYGKDFLTEDEVPYEKCKHCEYKNG